MAVNCNLNYSSIHTFPKTQMMKKKIPVLQPELNFPIMKKIILISSVILLNWQGTAYYKSDVYLCDSSGGKKYHYSKNCRGLSNCQHKIIKMSLQKAKSLGKDLCGWED